MLTANSHKFIWLRNNEDWGFFTNKYLSIYNRHFFALLLLAISLLLLAIKANSKNPTANGIYKKCRLFHSTYLT